MKLSTMLTKSNKEIEMRENGRVLARGMHDEQVQRERNMAKAQKRRNTMLEIAAEQALRGGN